MIVFSGTDFEGIGGMEVHLRGMLDTLSRSSQCEKIFLITKSKYRMTMREYGGLRVYFFADFDFFAEHIRNITPDALFFNDGHWIEDLHKLRKIFPRAVFVMRSGGNEFVKAPYSDMTLSLSKRQALWRDAINENIDFIIANSVFTWYRMLRIGIAQGKILIVRGGVDLTATAENVANKNRLRRDFDELFGTHGRYIFCIAARHVKFKKIIDVLEIFNAIKSFRNWFLLIAGDGIESAALWRYCADNFPHDNFAFLGALPHEEIMRYIALSDCLISSSADTLLPSGDDVYIHTETMGRSIIEAVCQRVFVLATEAGGVREWFDEIPGIGMLLPDDKHKQAEIIRNAFESGSKPASTKDFYIYGWSNIVNFYCKLFKKQSSFSKTALCLDLDDTVVHSFLSYDENVALLEKIFSFDCEIIINTAEDFADMLICYPIIAKNIARLTVIANCGKVIIVHGYRDILWQNYYQMQPEITAEEIAEVEREIADADLIFIRKRIIDKLYINFKVEGDSDEIARVVLHLNSRLSNSSYLFVNNLHNIKLISKIINKGGALAYLKNFQMRCDKIVGVGNDVLDELFMVHCDKFFMINPRIATENAVNITTFKDADNFIERLHYEVI